MKTITKISTIIFIVTIIISLFFYLNKDEKGSLLYINYRSPETFLETEFITTGGLTIYPLKDSSKYYFDYWFTSEDAPYNETVSLDYEVYIEDIMITEGSNNIVVSDGIKPVHIEANIENTNILEKFLVDDSILEIFEIRFYIDELDIEHLVKFRVHSYCYEGKDTQYSKHFTNH